MPAPVIEPPKPKEEPIAPPRRDPTPSTPPRRHPLMPTKRPDVMPRPKMNLKQRIVNRFLSRRANQGQLEEQVASFKSFYVFFSENTSIRTEKALADLINHKYRDKLSTEDIPYIFEADPTNQKSFVGWIAKQAAENQFIIKNGEDVDSIKRTLTEFLRFKHSPKFINFILTHKPGIEQPTNILLYSYKSLVHLLSDYSKAHTVKNIKAPIAAGAEYVPVLRETLGLTKLAQKGTTVLWQLSNPITANKILQPSSFCQGDWCVKDPQHYKTYAGGKNSIIVFEINHKLEYLCDTKTGDFKDKRDQSIPLASLKDILMPFKEEIGAVFRAARHNG
jgi:hypothetical protein